MNDNAHVAVASEVAAPAGFQSTGESRVVVARCPSYSPVEVGVALTEVFDALGGFSKFVKAGQTVLLKPNLFSLHPPEDAVTTHPELVRQILLLCVKAGAGRVWVGDSPVGLHSETELWLRTGMTAAVAGTPAELKSWQVKQIPLQCGDDVLAVPEWYREVDVVISLPKLKTHNLTTLTCGLKNVYGIVNGPAKSQFHVKYPSPLAMSAFLVRVFGTFKPQLTIADAVVAMEGNGPAHGHPVPVGALLGSRDAVALDAVACRALRISPSAVPMIRLAAKSQLGQMNESRIECTGSGVSRLQSVKMKPSLARYLRLFPEWSFWLTPRLFRLRPHIKILLCEKCGICAGICPKQAITKNERTGYPDIDHSSCIDCFCCLESCPQSAIAARLYLANLLCLAQQRRKKVVVK
jgi:uncharacterized protein (DUF362 family)/Pyruvate/2-oxoacid:ferredoxin oxidoreductase delta subunit